MAEHPYNKTIDEPAKNGRRANSHHELPARGGRYAEFYRIPAAGYQ
jgi:hypothetical protein